MPIHCTKLRCQWHQYLLPPPRPRPWFRRGGKSTMEWYNRQGAVRGDGRQLIPFPSRPEDWTRGAWWNEMGGASQALPSPFAPMQNWQEPDLLGSQPCCAAFCTSGEEGLCVSQRGCLAKGLKRVETLSGCTSRTSPEDRSAWQSCQRKGHQRESAACGDPPGKAGKGSLAPHGRAAERRDCGRLWSLFNLRALALQCKIFLEAWLASIGRGNAQP